jgi:hypothetical protein
MNITRSLIIALLISAASPALAAPAQETAEEVISRYVIDHTGWKRSLFRIKKGSASHGNVQYEVIYIPEERATPRPDGYLESGGGKSFAVDYDPRKQKVIREWHYQ